MSQQPNTESQHQLRVGNGFDSHRLEVGYKLILGGVEIPHSKGLKGHSDADVLTHAVIDSLLGAAGLDDIGQLFPPSEEKYKGISSLILLKEVCLMLQKADWRVVNVDCVLICEKPKIIDYKKQIKESLASSMQIAAERVNLKGKTAEKMGALGREEGIAAIVVSLLEKKICR